MDAAEGKTRTRNTLHGPSAAAYSNSMRVRVDTFNAFAEYLGEGVRIDSPPPADGDFLTPDESEKLLRNLAVRRPLNANATTSLRTAAVAELACRQRTALELHQFHDCTYAEVAARLDMTPKAAKSLLYRARNQLREVLLPFMS